MKERTYYEGIIPAFYACYDAQGRVDGTAVRALATYLLEQGVHGLYVGGSSGECIYQSVAERKLVLEQVMAAVGGKMTIIAHVACNNTDDSCSLAAHAESVGVTAIAAIPPIYFHLPASSIAQYWNDISAAAPNTDFIIYNIPQLAGVALTVPLLQQMLKNPRVIGVKNSSMPIQDIQRFRSEGTIVFNGPDEQLVSGLAAGAIGGIGGTYGVMPRLYLRLYELFRAGQLDAALALQDACCAIIDALCATSGNMYAAAKEVIRQLGGPDAGSVRKPLLGISAADAPLIMRCVQMIRETEAIFC